MDKSLSNFEMTDSTLKTDSESGSDKSENLEIVGYGDVESNSSKSSEDANNSNLPSTVTELTHEVTGAKVYLVGTAHFSKESQEDVQKVIRQVQPHVVVVELCSQRTSILALDEKHLLEEAKTIDMAKIIATIKSNGAVNGVMYLLLLNMNAHITKELGMAPGGEFRTAYKEVENIPNCHIYLGDRPIKITMRRALAKLTWFQTLKLTWHLLTTKDSISVEEIEQCKNRDMLEQLLANLAGEYPAFREVFLDERDVYLTNSLQMAAKVTPPLKPGNIPDEPLRVVGIVGIGHTPGIIKLWPTKQEAFIPAIMSVPPPSLSSKLMKLTFKITLYTLGGYIIYKYAPVPKVFRDNLQTLVHKLIDHVRLNPNIKYSLIPLSNEKFISM